MLLPADHLQGEYRIKFHKMITSTVKQKIQSYNKHNVKFKFLCLKNSGLRTENK
jgi:hypothetical protein